MTGLDRSPYTPGAGRYAAVDVVDLGPGDADVPYVKIVDGSEGGYALAPVTSAQGLAVNPRRTLVRRRIAAVISTSAYAAGDAMGGELLFSVATRYAGGAAQLLRVQVTDKTTNAADLELHLFSDPLAGTFTDNAPFDPTDADLANYLGTVVIAAADWKLYADNAVADVAADRPFVPLATSNLYGYLVIRSVETYVSSSDIAVIVSISQD